ncbi:MurR/RpiR family transcriptional regulator [Dolosicoccus paucivorans]
MRINELINKAYEDFSENDRNIASNVIFYQYKIENMTLQDFADISYTSKSSVIRFSQKLGFKGYTELKNYIMLQDREEEYDSTQSMHKMLLNNIESTLNHLKRVDLTEVYQCMDQAANLYIIYTGLSQANMAEELRRYLLLLNKPVQIIPPLADSNEFKKITESLHPRDVIFLISLSGENKKLKSTVDTLKLYDCKLISITTIDPNELAGRCDYNLYAYTGRSPLPKDWWIQTSSTFFIVLEAFVFGYIDYLKKQKQ